MSGSWRVLTLAALLLVIAGSGGQAFISVILDHGTPVRLLAQRYESEHAVLVALGELTFKARRTLGDSAFSCDGCHPDGRASLKLFFAGLSDKPGNIDVTNKVLSQFEDGIVNPVNSLWPRCDELRSGAVNG